MRLGILSDIHEAVELLGVALARLDRAGVDRLVVLGDVFETGPRLDATVALLEATGAGGVYGNHDHGLSVDPDDYIRSRFSARSLAYMGSLLPRVEIDGALFAHREPWLDCSDVFQVWHVEDVELASESIRKSFAAAPNRSIFIGHFHRWAAFGPVGRLDWEGDSPLELPDDVPTLVVVAAICDGHSAIFDTEARVLTPIDLYADQPRPDHRPLPPLVTS
jgi:hypothetical protein